MIRLVAMSARTLSLWLMLAPLAPAQEAPPLEPPSLDPPATGRESKPAKPRPVVTPPSRPQSENRPMLAIPGVTAPAARPMTAARPPATPPALLPMPLDHPISRSEPAPAGFPLAGPTTSDRIDSSPPRLVRPNVGRPSSSPVRSRPTTEPSPIGETIPLTIDPLDDEPPAPRGSSSRSPTSRMYDDRPARDEDDRIAPTPRPRRAPGLFSRLFGPPPSPSPSPVPPPPRESTRTVEKPVRDRESSAELANDPDLITRRKIERQIAATLGERVRSVEVVVTGRNVEIRARVSRFWYRRSVRRSLETLPAIQGYRSRIEVTD